MTIIIDPYTVPEKGMVQLKIERSFEIKVTAEEARRQVNRWLHNEVNMLVGAEQPTLVAGGEQVLWPVPAVFSVPGTGRVGVDVSTGVMDISTECKDEIEYQVYVLAAHLPPYQPKQKIPVEYLAKNVPPAPKLVINEKGFPVIVSSKDERYAVLMN